MNMWMKDHLGDAGLLERVDRITEIARRKNVTPTQVALAWVLQVPGLTSAIVGASTVAQLEENALAADLVLEDADLALLESWFPRTP